MTGDSTFKLPTPAEDVDYYVATLTEYTVSIDVCVRGIAENTSDVEMCSDAVKKFKAGIIDGDSRQVNSEEIYDVKLCWDTDLPFDEAGWIKAKLTEMGIHADGTPLRPGERTRPETETKLSDFRKCPWYRRLVRWITCWLPNGRRHKAACIKSWIKRLYCVPRDHPVYNYDMEKMLKENK